MRCFVIKTKPLPRLDLRHIKIKIPNGGFFNRLLKKRIIRFSPRKSRFISKRKTLASVSAMLLAGVLIIIKQNSNNNEVIPAFNIYSPDDIVSDVLPTGKERGIISEIKERISSLKKPEPGDIIKEYGGIFGGLSSPSPSPSPAPSQSQELPMPETKTFPSEQLFKNETDYSVSKDVFKNSRLDFSKDATILIMHTHTTECYAQDNITNLSDNGRSTMENQNMIAVGKVIKDELEAAGFRVIHDTTFHDYPSYQGAYGRSLSTAKKYLSENEDIELILDIHRDAVVNDKGNRVKLVKEINGTHYAQLMIVCGTDGGGLSHPGWRDNLNFAVKLQESMNLAYPGIMRPINLRKERFNQHLTKGSLIIEVGTHGNSLTEAKNSAALIGRKIGELVTR